MGALKNGGNGPWATPGHPEVGEWSFPALVKGLRSTYGLRDRVAEKAVGSKRFTMSS